MYKVTRTESHRYPWVALYLTNITTGEVGIWLTTEVYEEDLCKEYHVRSLDGVLLDSLPINKGEWISEKQFNSL